MGDHHLHTPKLPYDVILYVIETMLPERTDSPECIDLLRTFSLVSRRYVIFCQKRLFTRYNMGKTNSETCLSILQHSPHLIPYVQEVWMYLGGQGLGDVTVAEMEVLRTLTSLRYLSVSVVMTEGPLQFTTQWDKLALGVRRTIFNLLLRPQITAFTLRGLVMLPFSLLATWRHIKSLDVRHENFNPCFSHVDYLNMSSDGEDMDDEYTDTDFSRLSLTSQRTIQIAENSVVVRLEDLSLIDSDRILLFMLLDPDQVFDDECDNRLFGPPPPFAALPDPNQENASEALEANDGLDIDYDFPDEPPFSFNQLRSFTVDITANNLLPVWQLIHEARDSLRILDIRQRFCHKEEEDPFGFDSTLLPDHSPVTLAREVSLSPLLNLQKLSITILILLSMPIHPNTLSSWCSLLRTAPRGIHTLEITLDAFYFNPIGGSVDGVLLWFPNPDDDDDEVVAKSPLGSLDEIVSSPVYFPSLERVIIRVDLPEYQEIGRSDPNMIVDVVTELDMVRLNAWIEEYGLNEDTWEQEKPLRTPSSESMAVDAVANEDSAVHDSTGGDFEPQSDDSELSSGPDSSYIHNEPCFPRDVSIWSSSNPVPFERVEESISQMLRLTGERFRPTDSFIVEVDFGTHVRR